MTEANWQRAERQRREQNRRAERVERAKTAIVGTLLILGILTATVSIRWWASGQDWRCFLAADPALCATVAEVGR